MAFLAAENVNRQLENMLQAAFGCLPERFLSVRTKSITETFGMLKIRPIVCFCGDSKHVSILSLNANALHDFYSGIVDPFIFIY